MDDYHERYLEEQRLIGYQEGFEKGEQDGDENGFAQGMIEGSKIGSELGYTRGFLFASTQLLDLESSKAINRIPDLIKLIELFPKTNEPECEKLLLEIRAKTKRAHSNLKTILIDQKTRPKNNP